MFSESPDPRQWPHVATGITYRRALRELAGFFGCDASEQAVYEFRLASDPAEYASKLLRATGTDVLLVDDGFPPPGTGVEWRELGGPPVACTPDLKYGASIIRELIPNELAGSVDWIFESGGVCCKIQIPREAVRDAGNIRVSSLKPLDVRLREAAPS